MNDQDTIDELFTEWVNDNRDRILFAAWVGTLTKKEKEGFVKKFSRCEDAPCCGCCE